MDNNIVEMIPDMSEWPDWAVEGFRNGDFFRRAILEMDKKELENESYLERLNEAYASMKLVIRSNQKLREGIRDYQSVIAKEDWCTEDQMLQELLEAT